MNKTYIYVEFNSLSNETLLGPNGYKIALKLQKYVRTPVIRVILSYIPIIYSFIYSINRFSRLVRARQVIFFAFYTSQRQKLKFLSVFQSDDVKGVKNEEMFREEEDEIFEKISF